MPSANNEAIENRLMEWLTPAVLSQMNDYRELGRRSRILPLPLMLAAVLTSLWRQVPSVPELCRRLEREDWLWCKTVKVSQPALRERFLVFPTELFERVYKAIVPNLKERCEQRQRRLPVAIQAAGKPFDNIGSVDGSPREARFHKWAARKAVPTGKLAGKMCLVLASRRQVPVELWFPEKAAAFEPNFIPQILALLPPKPLLSDLTSLLLSYPVANELYRIIHKVRYILLCASYCNRVQKRL